MKLKAMLLGLVFGVLLMTVSAWAGTVNYTYDQAGRLTKADYGDGKSIEYTYDKAGNLLQRTVGGAAAALDLDGWWYTSTEPGTGLSIGVENDVLFLAWYVYSDAGAAEWYVAWCAKGSGNDYSGDLLRFTGWNLGSDWEVPTSTKVGEVSLSFTSSDAGSLTWDLAASGGGSGSKTISKYMPSLVAGSLDPRDINGWFIDNSYSGMGWFMEARGDTIYVGWYHYKDDKSPRWWVMGGWTDIGGFTPAAATYQGTMMEFRNGQTLGGAFKEASQKEGGDSVTLTINGSGDSLTATIEWNGNTYNLSRYTITMP